MENYLVLIRKSDFIDLFKYGSLYINENNVRHFTCSIESLKGKKAIFDDLVRFSNDFESTFSYLILHYTKQHDSAKLLRISDVKHIYPLDYEAMREFKSSFDSRIRIEEPLWPECVYELQKKRALKDCLKGVDNIWSICNIENSLKDTISEKYILVSMIEEIVSELYENRRPSGDLPFWVYVMRYERHSFYPINNYGYFMDAVHAILNYNAQRELFSEEIENTYIIKSLKKLNDEFVSDKLDYILTMLEKEIGNGKFLTYITNLDVSINLLKCVVLFFMFRDRYIEGFKYESAWINRAKREQEFPIVMYMLGVMLQHEHTYDSYYERLKIDIFKSNNLGVLFKEIKISETKSSLEINNEIVEYQWGNLLDEERKVRWYTDSPEVKFSDESILYPKIDFSSSGTYKVFVEICSAILVNEGPKAELEIVVKLPTKGISVKNTIEDKINLKGTKKKTSEVTKKRASKEKKYNISSKTNIIANLEQPELFKTN